MKLFDTGITRMIGLPYGEKNYDDMLSRFHLIPERYRQTGGRTDLLYQYQENTLTQHMSNVCIINHIKLLSNARSHDNAGV